MADSRKPLNNPSRKVDSMGKVVVHTRKHQIHRGFSKKELITDEIRVLDENGEEKTFSLSELKAVFFVKDFSSDPAYDEVIFLGKDKPHPWLWAHVEFEDGEIIEGRIRNGEELISNDEGFFLWISDKYANNESVYVIKASVRRFRIMGLV